MKIPIVFITILVFCLAFLVMVDLISGIAFSEAINILAHSFTIVTAGEKIIVFATVAIPFIIPFVSFFIKKKQAKTK
ncbi:hypothetical protein [Paenibacillus prosopidis]|uniref:Uncharacterized protein n=1 Tax=Paenibacillus prosopidis TaxID=630520 RepID=A0A368VUM9_9BACL|nr:hypothetical protein [Paenibacillus prosopidis]RCW45509.1 hypothetical protein DFP97_11097 [Paenibacillus prosopidis]